MKKLFTLLFALVAIVSTTFATVTNELNKNESIPLDAVYHADFRNFKSSLLGWFVEDKLLPDQFNYIWKSDSRYGMVASGYLNGSNHKTESWLISDPIDLSSNTVATFSFSHARKFGELSDLSVQISKDGYSWQTLTIPYWPDGTNWIFINSGEVDITPYISTTTQIAFVYKSTTSSAATWEIGDVLIKGDGKYIDNEILPSGTCGENSFWEYKNSTLTISGNGKMRNYLWIPWSGKSGEIEKIIIQAEVPDIIGYAFRGITVTNYNFINHSELDAENHNYWGADIVDVEVDGLLIRNDTIFACRPYVSSVVIPNTITYIVSNTFDNCSSLTSVVWNAKNCASSPFYDLSSQITSFTFGESVEHIPADLCYQMDNLTSITIPNSVTSIGDYAFEGCSSLTSIVVEEGNTVYDSRENCNAIIETASNTLITGCKNTTIPNSVTEIGYAAFRGCTGLTSITIPNSVTSIGRYAFYNCDGLTSITIPNSVTSVGYAAFSSCSSLTSIIVEQANSTYDSRNNCNAIIETATNTLVVGCQTTIIPNSVTSIGERAFYYCDGLTSITIPNSVTSIGSSAFYGCSGLTSIESLAEVPPTLGTSAFYNTTIPVYVACGAVSAYLSAEGWKAFTNIQEPLAEHSIAVGVNDSIMGTAMVDYNTYCEGNQISATANQGYHFLQWSDGVKDNPRTIVLTQDTVLTAEFALTISGKCGDNLYWNYDQNTKTIVITGSGMMYDYTATTQPWYLFKEDIMKLTTSATTTTLGESAFDGCIRLGEATLGVGIEELKANVFAGCNRLYHIYSYPTYTPFAEQSSFANYNVYLHVPCESFEMYNLDVVFGNFKYIQCISSDEVAADSVVINAGSTDVTITWPTDSNAESYTIVIKKNGTVVCTLTFNSEGQLLNIAFAPGRNGNRPAQYAEATTNGYRFTVTGLEEGTDYSYTVTSKDAANKTISEHSGEFTTNSATALDNTHSQSANCQKLLRDGQLVIIRDGKTYNAQGVEL